MNKFLIFLGVSALLFIFIDLNLPSILYTIAYIILFFSIVGIIVFYVSTPFAMDLTIRRFKYFFRKYTDTGFIQDDDLYDDDVEVSDMQEKNREFNYYTKSPSPITLKGQEHVRKVIKSHRQTMSELSENLDTMSDMGEKLSKYNAENSLSRENTRNHKKRIMQEWDNKHDIMKHQHDLEKEKYLTEIGKLRQDLLYTKALIDKQKAENLAIRTDSYIKYSESEREKLKTLAKVNFKNAKTETEKGRASFVYKILNEGNINELSPEYRYNLLLFLINRSGAYPNEFDIREKILNQVDSAFNRKLTAMDADIEYKKQQADEVKKRNDLQQIKLDKEKDKTRRKQNE